MGPRLTCLHGSRPRQIGRDAKNMAMHTKELARAPSQVRVRAFHFRDIFASIPLSLLCCEQLSDAIRRHHGHLCCCRRPHIPVIGLRHQSDVHHESRGGLSEHVCKRPIYACRQVPRRADGRAWLFTPSGNTRRSPAADQRLESANSSRPAARRSNIIAATRAALPPLPRLAPGSKA